MKDEDKTKEQLIKELNELRFFRNVFDQLPVCTIIYDPSEKVVYRNRATKLIDGYEDEELLNLTRKEYLSRLQISNGKRKPTKLIFPKSTKTKFNKGVYSFNETTLTTKEGVIKNVLLNGGFIYDEENRLLGVCGCCLDITKHVRIGKLAEEALRLSEERFSKAFNANPCMMTITRLSDNKIIDANDSFLRTLGYEIEETLGRTSIELNHWVNPEIRLGITKTIGEQKSIHNLECQIRTKSGEKRVALVSAEILKLSGEECLLITANDITERKRAEEALINALAKSQKHEAEVKALFEGTRSVLSYQGFKETAREIFYSCMNLTGATSGYITLLNGENKHYEVAFIELGSQTCTTNLPLPVQIHSIKSEAYNNRKIVYYNNFANSECQKLIPEGHIRIDNVLLAPLMIDNQVVGLLCLGNKPGGFTESDVRVVAVFCELVAVSLHNNRTLASLRSSEELFCKAFNASPNPMSIVTLKDGRFINVNDSFVRIYGFSVEELLGHTATQLRLWVKPIQRKKMINIVSTRGTVRNLEISFHTKTGDVRRGLFSAELITLNGQECLLSTVNDITELRQLEKEMARLDRLNLVGEMAAGIGHEIRNPMTTVRGFLQMLGEKEECANFQEYFKIMIEELDRANFIISEYLSLAKNKVVEKKIKNINTILEALSPLIQSDAMKEEKNMSMNLGTAPDLLLDEKEIRQLILNLVRNGFEAMPPRGNLTIKTYMNGKKVVLSVQDEGKGIRPEHLEKIGTPFFTTKENGTGLGLAVCYSIAARHKATIKVETSTDGTTFFVYFKPPIQK